MSHKTTITLSMLWLGFLVAASRGWAGNVRDFVRTSTGHEPTPATLHVIQGGYAGDQTGVTHGK